MNTMPVQVYARARELGFKAVAHAGEEGPAANVADSLDLLHVSIDNLIDKI